MNDMIAVVVLVAQIAGGDIAMMPYGSTVACQAAMVGLQSAIVAKARCVEIEMIAPASVYAPEFAPLPVPKPGMRA